ncbi:MAG: replicative DNA helicase [Candidatus Marinimicrobia bacterium]|jgi:replicative DNA helicase|nr:replicative DNA helicase [Candidatus Neomarinimicrobiota bacterium]MDP6789575.1 replicative DNA helicase [Candidatus Neomarinimicrobiota bacterium]MDP7071845.1 replicative DNA helicase [Candidatus Neomarinimicrobiota bacterium]
MAENQEQILNVQPQSNEAEQAVLGAMLSSKEAVSKVLQWITDVHFYREAHAKIFRAMIQMFNEGEPVDTVSIVNQLKKQKELENVGGAYYITGLVESVPTTANVEHYAKIVLEKAMLRELIRISHDLTKNAYDDRQDVDDIMDAAEQAIFSITQGRLRGGFEQLDPILQETFENLDKIHSSGGTVTGVPTGLLDLDEMTSGFQKGELIVLAGRPGMGKTALALTIARNAAIDHQKSVGFFSLEMASHQLAMRMLCAEARVDSHLVRTGKLPKSQWQNLSVSVGTLAEAPMYLDDTPSIGILELRAKARRLMAEHDIGMLMIDYLQLMSGPKGVENRQQEISVISRSLKALAKELNIPVVALSQLSRATEQRSDRRPQLSDLRESGAIEQDADVVMFVYRPYVYSRDEDDRGKVELLLSKQRNGPTGNINLTFIDRYARFENLTTFSDLEAEVPF